MSVPPPGELVGHMREAAEQACLYVEGLDKEDFLADKRTQQAVILNLIILGEAATKVMDRYPAVTDANPAIPWKSMRGMRNRIAHGYYDINLDVVWDTVSAALPELVSSLSNLQQRWAQTLNDKQE